MSTPQPPPDSSFTTKVTQTPHFECECSYSDRNAVWIRIGGELDLFSVPPLKQTLDEALENQRLVVVDLRELTFMDSTGLSTIIDSAVKAERRGVRLVFTRGTAQINQLFALVGIADRLEIIDLGGD